jgi:uncharacterized protein YjiS (DUF1127 family)
MIAGAEPRRVAQGSLVDVLDLVLTWIERARQRTDLGALEANALHDLGLSRADRDAECAKYFWQR